MKQILTGLLLFGNSLPVMQLKAVVHSFETRHLKDRPEKAAGFKVLVEHCAIAFMDFFDGMVVRKGSSF